jgi:hypothetical protein
MREHPHAFEEAKAYEKDAVDQGSPFTWSQNESLEQLSRPERIAEIERDYEVRAERIRRRRRLNPLRADLDPSVDDVYGVEEAAAGCVICHK